MRWQTRTHWLWGLLIPARLHIFLIILAGALTVTFGWLGALMGAPIFFVGVSGASGLSLRWRSFSLSVIPGDSGLWERYGFEMLAERRINMNMVGSTEFQQTLLGRILDYGNLSIGALGGPYTWENLGQFQTLRRIIESQGKWMPPPRGDFLNALDNRLRRIARSASRFLWEVFQIRNGLEREARLIIENLTGPDYHRFLRFAQEVLFPPNLRRPGRQIVLDPLRSADFTEEELRVYRNILSARRLIVSDLEGRLYRHKRIRTPRDIRRHIPGSWFRRAVRSA